MKRFMLLMIGLTLLALTGCSTLTVTSPDGTTLKYNSFMGTTDNLKTGGTIPVTFKGAGSLDLQALMDAMKVTK
jgi:ABC-type phosphate transport system substrate-binding protein